jgi:hypothetical protein
VAANSRDQRFVLCIKNDGYAASLGLVRVADESGEDYLYPADYFVPIDALLSEFRTRGAARPP